MNKCFIIILYVVEGSEKLFTFCRVSIFRKRFRTEWFRKFVFNFNLTGVYYTDIINLHYCKFTVYNYSQRNLFLLIFMHLITFEFNILVKCLLVQSLCGPRQANLVLIAYASSEGSGETARMRRLA